MERSWFPSPLVGEGAEAKRRRGRGCYRYCAYGYPSPGASRHLLPQGEKGKSVTLNAHRLDIIPIRINQKRRVIRVAVILARSRRAVVLAAGLQARGVKLLDRGVIRRLEGDMSAGARDALVQIEPQRGRALGPEAGTGL